MKKLYHITHRPAGKGSTGKTDWMDVFANSMTEAIREFESVKFGPEGYEWSYTEHAIIKIETK